MKPRIKAKDRPKRQPHNNGKREGHGRIAATEDLGKRTDSRSPKFDRGIPPAVPNGFLLNESGVYKIRHLEHDESPRWICAPLGVLAHTRSTDNEDWGKLLAFWDPDGKPHEWILPMSMLARDGAEFRSKLLSLGLNISAAQNAQNDLRQYIQMARPSTSARTVERIGWVKNAGATVFVLPDENIGRTRGEIILLQSAHQQSHLFRAAGSLDEWRKNVAYYCQGNSLLAFAVSCAFAAPLLPFSGDKGGGFHLVADTSVGKTTILMVGGSVWGGGQHLGFLQSWLTTANGLENTAELHNHCLLCLDELKLINPEDASKVAYTLSNGQGKTRRNRDGGTERKAEWQLLFLSTGELSLQTHLDGVESRFYAGQSVRFCEIPARVDEHLGAFEQLHSCVSAKALADHLKQETRENCYGTAGRAFLREVIELGYDEMNSRVKELAADFIRRYIPEGLPAEVMRAADRFALVAAAGELATQLDITGWIKGTAAGSVAKCFDAWRHKLGTSAKFGEQGAIATVRAALIAHGDSRFQYYEPGAKKRNSDSNRIHNRIGFRTSGALRGEGGKLRNLGCAEDSSFKYVLKRESLPEICKPYEVQEVIDALRKKNLLQECRLLARETPPGLVRGRYWVISPRIFEDEQLSLEFQGKPTVPTVPTA